MKHSKNQLYYRTITSIANTAIPEQPTVDPTLLQPTANMREISKLARNPGGYAAAQAEEGLYIPSGRPTQYPKSGLKVCECGNLFHARNGARFCPACRADQKNKTDAAHQKRRKQQRLYGTKITPIDPDEFYEFYCEGLSIAKIADGLGTTTQRVYYFMCKYDIPPNHGAYGQLSGEGPISYEEFRRRING